MGKAEGKAYGKKNAEGKTKNEETPRFERFYR